MNIQNRKQLQVLWNKLDDLKSDLELMKEAEQEKVDNMPEGLADSEQGQKMSEGADLLDSAVTSLEECLENLQNAIDL